jgi:putative NADPH-quinone reductase
MHTATLLTAHPLEDSFNAALAKAWRRGAEASGARVLEFDVTRLDFDPVLRGAYRAPMKDEPDLAAVRSAFEASSHVTWLFPTWWAGMPAAMKGLVDRLMLPNWAFRFEGRPTPTGLMAGRSTRYVTTMDSPGLWYRLWHGDALAGGFGRGTLKFVGFSPVERTLIFGARRLTEKQRARWLTRLEEQGRSDLSRAPTRALPEPQAI